MTTPTKEQIEQFKIGDTVYFCDACGYVIANMIYDKKRNTYFVTNQAGERGIDKNHLRNKGKKSK